MMVDVLPEKQIPKEIREKQAPNIVTPTIQVNPVRPGEI